MKIEIFTMTLLINLILLVFIAAVVFFISELFRLNLRPEDCLTLASAIILFLVYPSIFAANRGAVKK